MTQAEWLKHKQAYLEYFDSIPWEHRVEAEALFQAFRSRILCEIYPPGGNVYGHGLRFEGSGTPS